MTAWKSGLILAMAATALTAATHAVSAQTPAPARLRLELFVKDVPKSAAFYKEVLEFETVRDEKTYVVMRLGTVEFGIGATAGLPKGHYFRPEIGNQRNGLGAEIVLEVDDVQAAYDRVKQHGHPILSPLTKRPWGLTDFRIADPDGYYLRISSSS